LYVDKHVTAVDIMVQHCCRICYKAFARNSSLRRHVKQYHSSIELPPPCQVGRKPSVIRSTTRKTCHTCRKSFSSRQSLSNHRRRKHRQALRTPRRSAVEKMDFC